MNRSAGLFAIGIAFFVIGMTTNSAFYGVGIVFLVLGLAQNRRTQSKP